MEIEGFAAIQAFEAVEAGRAHEEEALISTTSPARMQLNAASTAGMSGTSSAKRLLEATITTTATPDAAKFC